MMLLVLMCGKVGAQRAMRMKAALARRPKVKEEGGKYTARKSRNQELNELNEEAGFCGRTRDLRSLSKLLCTVI